MKLIRAKYRGKCCECGEGIQKGDVIGWDGRAFCEGCAIEEGDAERAAREREGDEREGEFPPSAAVLAADRRSHERGVSVFRFSSGAVMTQNRRGRCEDAPCCGCCS
jgi:hypothetical protein